MNTSRPFPSRLVLAALLASGTLVAVAALAKVHASTDAGAPLPQEMRYGAISYLTGGAGHDEAAALKAIMDKYPLAIELFERDRHTRHELYTANALVRIRDHAGKEIFKARAEGPFMLVQLEPGAYSMTATLNERTLHKRDFNVLKGRTTREAFVFPAGTD